LAGGVGAGVDVGGRFFEVKRGFKKKSMITLKQNVRGETVQHVLEFVLPKTVLLLPPVVNTSHNICC
jgi:hypothetical protein